MFDYLKLKTQFSALGYRSEVVTALVSIAVTLDKYDLTDSEKETVYELLSQSGREKTAILPDKLLDGNWEPFNYGNVKVGDYVRVRPDAYDSDTGRRHNGLVGILTRMSGHKCSVEYLGEATGNAIKHPMDNLESLRIR